MRFIALVPSAIITFIVIRCFLALFTMDAFTAIIPAWHTVIYPREVMLTIFSVVILIGAVCVYLIFKFVNNLVVRLLERFR